MGAPGPPDIVGGSSEIIGFRNRGGGPVGHPQDVQVETLILNMKCLPKGHHPWGPKACSEWHSNKETKLAPRPLKTGPAREMVQDAAKINPGDQF
jgi:hypothetical protein